jgi:DNA polymerase-1
MMYKCVTTLGEIRKYLSGAKIIAFDFETAPDKLYLHEERAALDAHKAHIAGVSFSISEGSGIYVTIAHQNGENADKSDVIIKRI